MKFLIITLILATQIFAAPAFNKTRDFKQADGTTFKARALGNQHLNWIETEDGEVLKYNSKNKNFEYATIKNNRLRASGTRYEKNDSKRARATGQVNKLNKDELYKLWSKKQKESKQRSALKH